MKYLIRVLLILAMLLCLLPEFPARAAETELIEEITEISGAAGLYDSLDEETRALLDQSGAASGRMTNGFSGGKLFQALSGLLRERLTEPMKALAALIAVILLCRLAGCLEGEELSGAAGLAGALTCAAVVALPLLRLIRRTKRTVEAASAFLLASVPVYAALLAASGSPATGASYSFLTLAVGNAVPVAASAVVFPVLHIFLALAMTSAVSREGINRLAESLYSLAKWVMTLVVTVFSGLLSVQSALNAHVDAASSKVGKLAASAMIPIVGGAVGDAAAVIQNSIGIVKSGTGAFGILAALCIFAPTAMEAVLWSLVCGAGQLTADLLQAPRLSSFLKLSVSAAKMILAVISAVCMVCVVCAAVLLFVKGGG